ncbi:MarR family winged helix-turn-helix transcriptional regulator [Catenulispora pinistramenti]|uniref:MarR family winged helix-turn-helix transcriptional regulator n=1 Tax=Catenulispora pinistramenti TaxID=2705254 RepID=UPI002E773F54|nr:MarR family transcriptional regulator [Catenulispora pinistramenti]
MEPDTHEVVEAVLAASRLIVGLSAHALAEVDATLTLRQLRTLAVLADRQPMKQADLAADLGVNPSTVLRMADRLAAAGLLERQPNPDSRREQLLILTPDGEDLVRRVMDRRYQEIAGLVGRLTPDDRAGLVDGLRALTEVVQRTYPESLERRGL